MKQHITKKQFDEINNEKKIILFRTYLYGVKKWDLKAVNKQFNLITIGRMIEFLGDDLLDIVKMVGTLEWKMDFNKTLFFNKELVDCCWEAVKYKLKA